MVFIYGRQDMPTLARAQENCFLYGNGLGGYASLSAAFSMTRCDHGLLVAARTAPNDRVSLAGRLQETLTAGGRADWLSTQDFADGTAEDGWKRLSSVTVGDTTRWIYDLRGVRVTREVAVAYGENTVAAVYTVENRSQAACELRVRPFLTGCAKSSVPEAEQQVAMADGCITVDGYAVYMKTSGAVTAEAADFRLQAYRHDAPDGRPAEGLTVSVCSAAIAVAAGETQTMTLVLSDKPDTAEAAEIIAAQKARMAFLRETAGLQDPAAQQLVCAADAYIADRESTGGRTILAGYPFFGDWGRDTMIALPGCVLSTGRYEEAKSILRTFFAYEKDGLVPNLFPEGTQEPMYNTVDAALLLVNSVYLYAERTGDTAFIAEAWQVMKNIIAAYKRGTRHGIYMDTDGLICAGEGLDQVTWMDVRVGDILPTPRHGKPVEINAYWYNALRIMERYAPLMGEDGSVYGVMAETVKTSFLRAFWREDAQCLRDVISGTAADEQIRCNQIWAVTMPFGMLSPAQERAVTDAVYAHLYTPCGLRTLSPDDAQYHGVYAGEQKERDMAYHQGTSWVFPLGAYFLAYLKTRGNTPAAAAHVREALCAMLPALREGCAGQLPEIYDGDAPAFSRGCFAQAWSVGEMLRVYEAVERIERGE